MRTCVWLREASAVSSAPTDLLVGDRAETGLARKLLAGELDFHRVALAPEVDKKFVFHAAVSMAAQDGPLTDEVWRDVAESIAAHLGLSGGGSPCDDEVRWGACRGRASRS